MRAPLIAVFLAAAWMHPSAALAAGPDPQAKKAAATPGGHAAKAGPGDAGAKTPAATASAAKPGAPSASAEKPAAAGASAAKPAPAAAASVDLAVVRDRIHARVADVIKAQSARRDRTPAAPAGRSRAAAATRRASAPPRIDLVWRPTVTWPQEITAAPDGAAQPAEALPATPVPLSLTWGPQP